MPVLSSAAVVVNVASFISAHVDELRLVAERLALRCGQPLFFFGASAAGG